MNIRTTALLRITIIFISLIQVCWAEDIHRSKYSFDRFYDEMWTQKGYSEVDRRVCHDFVKVLNETNAGPMICLMAFPADSLFENLEWSQLEESKALELEQLRLGRSGGSSCKVASSKATVDEKLTDKIIGGEIVYQSAAVDVDNNGEKDLVFKKVWKQRLCDEKKEYVSPLGAQLMYACTDRQGRLIDVLHISSLDGFKYRNKYFLLSWHGVPPSDGYININEYVSTSVGAETLYGVRQLCRINYQGGQRNEH